MTPADIALIRHTFAEARRRDPALGPRLHAKLFQQFPMAQGLSLDPDSDQDGFLSQVSAVISLLDDPAALGHTLSDFAAPYRASGAEMLYHAMIGAALLGVLRDALGDAFTPEVERAWIAGCLHVARTATEADLSERQST